MAGRQRERGGEPGSHPVSAARAPGESADGAGMPPGFRRLLRRRIVVAVVAKLALLTVLYLLFFSPSHRPRIDDAKVDRLLLPTR